MVETVKPSPIESLMVEHSILRRALMIYEECIRRMEIGEEFNPDLLVETTDVIKAVIITHHALLEHEYIFPRFVEAGLHVEMAKILTRQHMRVGQLQEIIYKYSNKESIDNESHRHELIDAMQKSIRVFRPHIDQEDTEMFPDFKEVVTVHEYYELGEKFREIAQEKWGGYGPMVDKIIHVEKALGINDLDSFTPSL